MDRFTIFSTLIIVFGISSLIFTILMSKITVKKYDELLALQGITLPFNYALVLPNTWGRAMTYSVMILFYNLKKNHHLFKWRYKNYYKMYGDFDFREHASYLDMILAVLNILFIVLILVSFVLLIIPSLKK